MKINGRDALTLAAGLAAGVALLFVYRRLTAAADQIAAAPGRAFDAVKEGISDAVDYVASLPAAALETAIDVTGGRPRQGTDGWQFYPMEGVAIDPEGNYWRGTKIIWRAPK